MYADGNYVICRNILLQPSTYSRAAAALVRTAAALVRAALARAVRAPTVLGFWSSGSLAARMNRNVNFCINIVKIMYSVWLTYSLLVINIIKSFKHFLVQIYYD